MKFGSTSQESGSNIVIRAGVGVGVGVGVGRVSLTARVDIPRITLTFERRLDLHGGTVGTRDVGDAVPALLHLSTPWRQRGSAAARHSNPWHVARARLRLKCM